MNLKYFAKALMVLSAGFIALVGYRVLGIYYVMSAAPDLIPRETAWLASKDYLLSAFFDGFVFLVSLSLYRKGKYKATLYIIALVFIISLIFLLSRGNNPFKA